MIFRQLTSEIAVIKRQMMRRGNEAGKDRQYRTTASYEPVNKMILSECNDVSNKIRGKLQTTSSQFSPSISLSLSFVPV